MTPVNIRPATPADLTGLAELWQDKMVLLQQMDRRITLMPDGRARWQTAVAGWLSDTQHAIFVAAHNKALVGYIIGRIEPGPPGMLPERYGLITEIALDMHSYNAGMGRSLVQVLRAWFANQGIKHAIAAVPRRYAVEQAFWRALGATERVDLMWMK